MKLELFFAVAGLACLFVLGVFTLPVFTRDVRAASHIPQISVIRVPRGGIQPQAVVDGGTIHVLYFSDDPKAGDLLYVKSADWGGTWTAAIRVNGEPGSALAIGTIPGDRSRSDGTGGFMWRGTVRS
jgi:hypothetical protein